MKYITLILLLIPIITQAEWKNKTGTIRDTESMKSLGDFGVKMLLTPSDKLFRKKWESTKITPKVETTDTITQNATIAAVLIFHGCSPKKDGNCDVVSRFFLVNPDGSTTPAGGGPVWAEKPMSDGVIQLGKASLFLQFSGSDPLGEYKIVTQIQDRVSGKNLKLSSSFTVIK